MELTTLSFGILQWIYSLPSKRLTRDRPLEVLALGLSRSGTDSLQQALVRLGYAECHHGFRYILDVSETIPWIHLRLAARESQRQLTASDFDTVLGDCAAVTDTPGYAFAHELLTAYPNAKVILNYREDVEAWCRSVEVTINAHNRQTWFSWTQTFFESWLFWTHHVVHRMFFSGLFDHDFQRNGPKWHAEHYASLEERLKGEGRQFLKWKVQDGWEPLCEYLKKDVPSEPFPSGNAPHVFQARMASAYANRKARANRNMTVIGGLFLVAVSISIVRSIS